ncbi:Type IV secretory pathway, VirD4 component, TraG/TraD family ATPase [Streptomyces zhaozhouensis]|uniref:Type IV secretory pathway, VirD4 component, TraG/TraD family ATPase n=1 Tax=Streptomyces zhaozhouensis TaxID=1300267 RepID=A0A286E943_9ACTN|nr:type IV secretory system conjugative DNA transfer family protein [Streptomyces zhaozhouensis]SOD67445.1 Type IV secretory pathway, VirD4 component, TraG/TraD family ATPase [Streptomyces zhaozhouensis]
MTTNQPGPGAAGNGAPIAILAVIFGGGALFAGGWLGGTLGAAVAGGGWDPPPFSLASARDFVTGGPSQLWPEAPGAAVGGAVVLLLAVLLGGGLAAWRIYQRFSRPRGLANRRDVQALTPRQAAKRARSLRPSLKGVREVAPADRGLLIGDLDPGGPELRASDEDTVLAVMAPRAGKSSAVAVPAVLEAPGAALLTSNKADVFAITKRARGKVGTTMTLDPQGVAHVEREMWVDLLADARHIEGASRLAGHFTSAAADAQAKMDFWSQAARNTLTALFHSAAISGATVNDVLAWLATPSDRAPVNALRGHNDALADQLASTVAGAPETRDGIYETARQAVACLLDPQVAAWVTPDKHRPQFEPHKFVVSRDTLYLLSKNGGGSAAGVIAAVTDMLFRAGVAAGEAAGGRLPNPMRAILDEAANVCKIDDLPDLYSHLGSRGITPVTILQSYRQGVRVWGEPGMDSLWSASTVKLVGAGTDDAAFAENISRLIGEHKVRETSVSYGSSGRSTSTQRQRERILEAAQVRALPKGRGLLLATGVPVAMVKLRPWYAEPYASEIGPDAAAEEAAIAERAGKKALA